MVETVSLQWLFILATILIVTVNTYFAISTRRRLGSFKYLSLRKLAIAQLYLIASISVFVNIPVYEWHHVLLMLAAIVAGYVVAMKWVFLDVEYTECTHELIEETKVVVGLSKEVGRRVYPIDVINLLTYFFQDYIDEGGATTPDGMKRFLESKKGVYISNFVVKTALERVHYPEEVR